MASCKKERRGAAFLPTRAFVFPVGKKPNADVANLGKVKVLVCNQELKVNEIMGTEIVGVRYAMKFLRDLM